MLFERRCGTEHSRICALEVVSDEARVLTPIKLDGVDDELECILELDALGDVNRQLPKQV